MPTEQYVTPEKKRIVEDNLKQHNRVDPPHDADAQSTSSVFSYTSPFRKARIFKHPKLKNLLGGKTFFKLLHNDIQTS